MFELSSSSNTDNLGQSQQLIFIDTNLKDLISSFPVSNNTEIYLYQNLDDISQQLSQWENIEAVHIFSHGNDGYLQLGNTNLSTINLDKYTDTLSQWNNSLSTDADILFYGCNIAQTSVGEDFLQQLSEITGADINASDNLTGDNSLGGDWDLEYQLGEIDTESLALSNSELILKSIETNESETLTSDITYDAGLDIDGNLIIDGDVTITIKDDFSLSNLGTIEGNDDGSVDSITIEAGDNNVDISGFIGGDGLTEIKINSNSRINVNDGATLFTRQISDSDFSSGNYEDGNSIGDSGKIKLKAQRVIIGDEDTTATTSVKLLANVEDGSGFTPGDIEIQAVKKETRTPFILGFENLLSKVVVNEATVKADNITITSESEDKQFDSIPSAANIPLGIFGFDTTNPFGLQNKLLPVSAQVRGAEAFTTISNSNIFGSGDIILDASSSVDASAEAISISSNLLNEIARSASSSAANNPLNQVKFAAALGMATGQAETVIDGTTNINALGNVSVTSDTTTLANVKSSVVANINQLLAKEPQDAVKVGGSVAISVTNTTSKAIVDENVSIFSDRNVLVDANATVKSGAKAGTTVYFDGTVGLGFGLNLDNTDVKSIVDGKITAVGQESASSNEKITSENQIVGNTITFEEEHEYTTGDEIVYNASIADNPLGLLEEGETYTVQVIDETTITFVKQGGLDGVIDLDNNGVNQGSTQTISPLTTQVFDGSDSNVIDDVNNTVTFAENHNLVNGQLVTYYADFDSSETENVGDLVNEGDYFVIYVDENTIQLTDSLENVASQTEIALSTTTGDEHFLQFYQQQKIETPTYTNVSPEDDEINIDSHGLYTGQFITYEDNSGDEIGGLEFERSYFVVVIDQNNFKLADSYENAIAYDIIFNTGTVVDLTSVGTGAHLFSCGIGVNEFAPDDNTVIDSTNNIFTFENHGFSNGDEVLYEVDPTVSSLEDAPVELTFVPEDLRDNIDVDNDTIKVTGHGYETGDEITYDQEALGTSISTQYAQDVTVSYSLTQFTEYYVMVTDENTIQLALTAEDANDGSFLPLSTVLDTDAAVDTEDSTIAIASHGYSDGDVITLTELNNILDIENIFLDRVISLDTFLYANDTYYAIKVDDDTLKLALTEDDASNENAIDITVASPLNLDDDTIYFQGHELTTGQKVTYQADYLYETGTPIQYDDSGSNTDLATDTDYYVYVVDNNNIKLALTETDAVNGTNLLDLTVGSDDTIHGFTYIQENSVTRMDNPIAGLSNQEVYYAVVLDENRFMLAETEAEAINAEPIGLSGGEVIDLTQPAASGTHTFSNERFLSFDGSDDTVLDEEEDTITFTTDHGLVTGQTVTYFSDPTSSDPTLGNGVVYGETYYAIKVDDDTIQLAASLADATAGIAIPLTVGQGESHRFATFEEFQSFDPTGTTTIDSLGVDFLQEDEDLFSFANHGLITGDRITYNNNDNTSIGGLTDGTIYYVIKVSEDTFKLAATRDDAFLAEGIAFLDASKPEDTPHTLTKANELASGITVSSNLSAADNGGASASLKPKVPNFTKFLLNSTLWPYTFALAASLGTGFFSGNKVNKAFQNKLNEDDDEDKYLLAGGIALNYLEHNNSATVNGTLKSGTDINLFADTEQKLKGSAKGGLGVSGDKTSFVIAGDIGLYTNNVKAEIGDGAIIDARGKLKVQSDLVYPALSDVVETYKDLVTDPSGFSEANTYLFLLQNILLGKLFGFSSYVNHNVGSKLKVKTDKKATEEQKADGVALNFAYFAYDNNSEAIIGNADINQDLLYQNDTQSVTVDANTDIFLVDTISQPKIKTGLLPLAIKATKGISKAFDGIYSPYPNQGTNTIGASLGLQVMDNDTIAKIKTGANIHTGTLGEGLEVTSQEDLFHLTIGQPGAQADETGITGAGFAIAQFSNTIAQIESGVTIIGGPLSIDGDNQINRINYLGAFQASKKIGVGASAAVVELVRNTEALIGERVILADGSNEANGVDDDPAFREDIATTLSNGDNIDDYNTGDGGTVIDLVGNSTLYDEEGQLERGILEINAKNSGYVASATAAGTTSRGKEADTNSPSEEQEQGFGLGISGSVAINNLDEKAQAYINDDGELNVFVSGLDDEEKAVRLISKNKTGLYGLTGAYNKAFDTEQETNVGLVGAYSENDISHTTRSFILGANVVTDGGVKLDAEDTSNILGVAAGFAGTTTAITEPDDNDTSIFNVAGSVTLNLFNNSTEAFVRDAIIAGEINLGIPTIGTGADIDISALDKSKIISAAGVSNLILNNATSNATSVGLGVSVAFNETDNETRTYIYNSQVKAGDVNLNSQSKSRVIGASSTVGIVTSGVKSAATKNSFGISGVGSGTQNIVNNTIESFIGSDGTTPDSGSNSVVTLVDSSGGISVNAIDDTEVLGIAGVLSVAAARGEESATAFSVGVTVVDNDVNNKTLAQIGHNAPTVETTTVLAVDVISLDSSSENKTKAYSIAGAVSGSSSTSSGSFSFTGVAAATDNAVTNSTKAKIKNATVTSNNNGLNVSAQDKSKIVSDGGGAGAAISLGGNSTAAVSAGIGVSINDIANDTEAYIDNSTITVNGDLNIEATSTSTIDAFALGGSVSTASTTTGNGAALSLSGAGAGTNNDVKNTISAYINDSTVDSIGGNILISAIDESEITADSGGYSLALARGDSSLSASIGVSVAYNQVSNTVASYIDNSTVDLARELTIESDSSSKINALSIGGSVAGSTSTGSGGGLTLSGAGALANNEIDNQILATIRNDSDVETDGDIFLAAYDNSKIVSDAGGISLAVTLNSDGATGSVGAGQAINQIGKDTGHSVEAIIDNSTVEVTGTGEISLTADSQATIDTLSLGFAASGAISGQSGNLTFSGAASISENDIKMNVQSLIQNSADVITNSGAISLSSVDNSKITADGGALSLALSLGGSTASSLSVGLSYANSTINNTVQSLIDGATVDSASSLALTTTSTSAINTVALGGAFSGATGSGTGVALSGAGAGAYSKITNTVESAIINDSDVDAADAIDLQAHDLNDVEEGKKITTTAIGGSVSLSAGSQSTSIAVSAVQVESTINNQVRAYIGNDGTSDDLTDVRADSIQLDTESVGTIDTDAYGISIAVALGSSGTALSGGGTGIVNQIDNTVASLIQGGVTVTADNDRVSLKTEDGSTVDSTTGLGVVAGSTQGGAATLGVSTNTTTINNAVQASIDNATIDAAGNLNLDADSFSTIDAQTVVTSIAFSINSLALSGAGGDAIGKINSSVSSYIGDEATISSANTVDVNANTSDRITTETVGASGALLGLAVGSSVADSTVDTVTTAYLGGNIGSETEKVGNISIQAGNTSETNATVYSIAGAGIGGAVDANSATAKSSPNVRAYIRDDAQVYSAGDIDVTAQAQPKADADSLGVSAASLFNVGVSIANATINPNVQANIGNNALVVANTLDVIAKQILPGSGNSTDAKATGAGGSLVGSFNASEAEAINNGSVKTNIGSSVTLTITDALSFQGDANSTQNSYADGYNGGILAGGFNPALAKSNISTEINFADSTTIDAGSLVINIGGTTDNFAQSVAGGGGVISGRASEATTANNNTTRLTLGDSVGITADDIDIDVEYNSQFNAKADSVNASVVGGSGAIAKNTASSLVNVHLGTNTTVNTDNFALDVENKVNKAKLSDQNAEAGSGGLVDGSAVVAETEIEQETYITLGDGSSFTVETSNLANRGNLVINANNQLEAYDESKIVTGGAVPIAGSEAIIKNPINKVEVNIGDVDLTNEAGDIEIITDINAKLNADARGKVWGLAGGAIGKSLVRVDADNEINILTGANITGENINIRAGEDPESTTDAFDLTADTYLYNGSLGTGTNPRANADLSVDNNVNIASGSTLESVLDINLDAIEASHSLEAEGEGKSIGGQLVQTIFGWFNKNVSTTVKKGSTDKDINSGVTIDGNLIAGRDNQFEITINEDGTVAENIGDIGDVTTVNLALAQEIINEITAIDTQIADLESSFGADTPAIATLEEVKVVLQEMLESLGLDASGTAEFLSLPDISAFSGNISVSGNYLVGSGNLQANGDTRISITNNSDKNLLVNDLSIAEGSNGNILFNEVTIADNSDLNDRNLNTSNSANFTSITSSENQTPEIIVSNTNLDAPLLLVGEDSVISNPDGLVRLANTRGSIGITGDIEAETIDIDAGDNFFLTNQYFFSIDDVEVAFADIIDELRDIIDVALQPYTETFEAFSNPRTTFSPGFSPQISADTNSVTIGFDISSESSAIASGFSNNSGDALAKYNQILAGLNATDNESSIIARNNVFISAENLNVNGLIQSGVVEHDLTLDSSLNSIISNFATAANNATLPTETVHQYNNNSYLLSSAGTWEEAQAEAEALGGNLVTINSAAEQTWLRSTFNTGGSLWTGLTDLVNEGEFTWINGEEVTYDKWSGGQPNGGVNDGQDYVYLISGSGNWNDISNGQNFQGIIEIPGTAELARNTRLDLSSYIDSEDNNIIAHYDAESDRIEVEDVEVKGGFVYLNGNIINTDNGNIKVIDGYGEIDINNQTNYDLELNTIDAGGEDGIQGKVVIVDNLKDETTVITNDGSRTATYSPLANSTYNYRDYGNLYFFYIINEQINQGQTLTGWDIFSSTSSPIDNVIPSTDGNVWDESNSFAGGGITANGNTFTGNVAIKVTPEILQDSINWTKSGSKFNSNASTVVYRELYNYYFKADYDINIDFIGQDNGEITVNSSEDIYLNNSILNGEGDTSITSTNGTIQALDDLEIATGTLTLDAAGDIGSADAVININTNEEVLDPATETGALTATSTTGDIYLEETAGDLIIELISAEQDINLTVEKDILTRSTATSAVIKAKGVNLQSIQGSVGTGDRYLTIDSNFNNSTSPIGETGQITGLDDITTQNIAFDRTYNNPVVFALPPSHNGADVATVRVSNVTSTGFDVILEEASNHTLGHIGETVNYIVLEAGEWELADGRLLEVGTVDTDKTVGAWETVNFDRSFENKPFLFHQIQTENETDFVKTRINQSFDGDGFLVALEEDEANKNNSHATETIGYMAFGNNVTSNDWDGVNYQLGSTGVKVNDQLFDINFTSGLFDTAPNFSASLNSYYGGDPAGLRYISNTWTQDGVKIFLDEDTSVTDETTHVNELVHYLAIENDSTLYPSETEIAVKINSAAGVHITETDGDLYLDTASASAGDVSIEVNNGTIVDRNTEATEDTAAEQAILQAVWEELQLTADDGAQNTIDATIANYEQAQNQLYEIYWEARNLTLTDEVYTADAYDSTATYTLSDLDLAQLEAYGYEDYHALHNYLLGLGATATYNEDYSYSATAEEVTTLSDGGVWSQEALENTINAGLLLPISDTETVVEEDNIAGQDVTLIAIGIGRRGNTTILDLDAIASAGGATNQQLLAFVTAERSDVVYLDSTNAEIEDPFNNPDLVAFIEIEDVDDVDLEALTQLSVTSTGDVFIGSENDLTIGQIDAANQEVRLKTGAGIDDSNTTDDTNQIIANDLIIEAGDASIGSDTNLFRLELTGDLTARANNEIYLEDTEGNLDVDRIYAADSVYLKSNSLIADANNSEAENIRSQIINLDGVNAGSNSNYLEVYLEAENDEVIWNLANGDADITNVSSEGTLVVDLAGNAGIVNSTSVSDSEFGTTLAYQGFTGVTVNLNDVTSTFSVGSSLGEMSLAVNGGSGDDSIRGSGGNDLLSGNEGNDTVVGTAGSDTVFGGLGDDSLAAGGDATTSNVVSGDAGDDTVGGGLGNDYLDGGTESDSLIGYAGNDTLLGGEGNDSLHAGGGNDSIEGGEGSDTVNGGSDDDRISGDGGNDSIIGAGGSDTISGGEGDDYIAAGGDETNSNLVSGDGGADTIYGGNGNDSLDGGTESDSVIGYAGNDTLLGGEGNDSLHAGGGNDSIEGGEGSDTVNGGSDNDRISGDGGNDSIIGAGGSDTISGGEGDDYIAAGGDETNSNLVSGDAGADTIHGGNGDDSLSGGSDNDSLVGYAGSDTILGGEGNDTLVGGGDGDIFVFNALSEGIDTITDYNITQGDLIQVSGTGFAIPSFNRYDFSYDPTTGELAYQGTVFADLTNNPSAVTLAIDLGDAGTEVITLEGTEIDISIEDLTLTDNENLDFASADIDGESVDKVLTITNTGSSVLTLSEITITGINSDDFSFTTEGITELNGGESTDITVTFDPNALIFSDSTATLTINSNDSDEAVYTFNLIGLATKPEINITENSTNVLTNSSRDFGNVNIDKGLIEKTFTIENMGNTVFNLDNITITGVNASDFTLITTDVTELNQNESTTITVHFDPSASDSRNAVLTITNNDFDEASYGINLTGTGTQPEIDLTEGGNALAINSSLDFGAVDLVTGLATKTLTISNPGNEVLSLDDIRIEGTNATDFSLGSYPDTLDAGETADITITFDPSVVGSLNALLTIESNDIDEETYTINLTGTSNTPDINIIDSPTGSTVDFGSINSDSGLAEQTFTIENLGDGVLNLNNISITGTNASDFSFTPSGVSQLNPNQSINLTVQFDPTDLDTRNAILTIESNDSDEATYTINLTGTGAKPEINLTDGKADLATNSILDFGAIDVDTGLATQTITIENSGNQLLSLNEIRIEGTNASEFSFSSYPETINAGESIELTLTFDPDVTGDNNATLIIASNDSDEGTYTINLTGTGNGTEINVSNQPTGSSKDFRDIVLGSFDSSVESFTIRNLGNQTLDLDSISITGTNADNFSILNSSLPSELEPGKSTIIYVDFIPTTIGDFSASLVINNNDTDEGTYTINLLGTALEPGEINITDANSQDISTGSNTDLGSANIDSQTVERTFALQNLGDETLTVSGLTITGANAADFSVTSSSSNLNTGRPEEIYKEKPVEFTVQFDPSAIGDRNATLILESNDLDEGTYTIDLSGTGSNVDSAPEIKLTQGNTEIPINATQDFGDININNTAIAYGFTITNTGTQTLNLGDITITGKHSADFAITSNSDIAIAPGENKAIAVGFDPSAVGISTATLTINNNDSDESVYTIDLTGEGITTTKVEDSDKKETIKISGFLEDFC